MSKMSRSEAGHLGGIKTHKLWVARYEENPKCCFYCGNKLPYEKRKNKFCNHSCSASCNNSDAHFVHGTYAKKNCIQCGKETTNVKFCNHTCSSNYHENSKVNSPCEQLICEQLKRELKTDKDCLCCGKSMSCNNKKYCSKICYQKFEWDNLKARMETEGKAFSPRTAKRYIIEIHGDKCTGCGCEPVWQDKKLVLVLDHINGNSEDWTLTNLRLLCPNCDSQTPTFKGRNIGNGRHNRRQRYKEGKSY